ncbi:MAG: hypothetical protein JST16_14960, partial [Bdellovibrionales bacterium]|nr:hypothetical protein [Bdellovibrionales bacterium]
MSWVVKLLVALGGLWAFLPTSYADTPICAETVDRLLSPAKYSRQLGPSPQKSYVSHRPIQTLDDLLFAFSHG